jgi:hypothetical protein
MKVPKRRVAGVMDDKGTKKSPKADCMYCSMSIEEKRKNRTLSAKM